MQQPIN